MYRGPISCVTWLARGSDDLNFGTICSFFGRNVGLTKSFQHCLTLTRSQVQACFQPFLITELKKFSSSSNIRVVSLDFITVWKMSIAWKISYVFGSMLFQSQSKVEACFHQPSFVADWKKISRLKLRDACLDWDLQRNVGS